MMNTINSNLSGKRLLILGGSAPHCKVVKSAKQLGVITCVADYLKPEDSPAKLLADENYLVNILDVEAIVKLCREIKIDGVINVAVDPVQKTYQKICAVLNLPCYGNEKQFEVLTNKKAFKKYCIQNDIDVIPEYDANEIINNNINVEFPVIVKPADGRGSRGQTFCYDYPTLIKAIKFAKNNSKSNEVIVEKLMVGKRDFVVSYMFINGRLYLIGTKDRYLGSYKDRLNNICVATVSPSDNLDFYYSRIHSKVEAMLKSLGIMFGPVFLQGFIDGDTIRFYDPGFRMQGGEYERVYKQIYDIDWLSFLVEFALTGDMSSLDENIYDNSASLFGKVALQLEPALRPGLIKSINGFEGISDKNTVIVASLKHKPGDVISTLSDVNRKCVEIYSVLDGKKDVQAFVEYVFNTIDFIDENGNSMLIQPNLNN